MTHRFFTPKRFVKQNIHYVTHLLGITASHLDFSTYKDRIIQVHQNNILTLLGYQKFNHQQQSNVELEISGQVARQLSPRQIFIHIVDHLQECKIELPTYHTLADIIIAAFLYHEERIIQSTETLITADQAEKINKLYQRCFRE